MGLRSCVLASLGVALSVSPMLACAPRAGEQRGPVTPRTGGEPDEGGADAARGGAGGADARLRELEAASPPADSQFADGEPLDAAIDLARDGGAVDLGRDGATVTGAISHRFLKGVSSTGSGTVAIVGTDGKVEWEYPITGEANDAWLLPGNHVLFAFKTGCREVNPAKETVWEFKSAAGAQTHACQPIDGGAYLVGESRADGTSSLYEIDAGPSHKVLRTIMLNLGGGAHSQLREARKTPQGTYLTVQQRGGGKAQEWDATGKLLRTFPCGSFVAVRLPDGNTLIACGDDHRFIEVDARGQIVWQVNETDIPGNKIGFAAGVQRLPNGDTVLCNWAGHSGLHAQPQVIQVTRDKKVVWSVSDPKLGQISNIEILDPDVGVPLR